MLVLQSAHWIVLRTRHGWDRVQWPAGLKQVRQVLWHFFLCHVAGQTIVSENHYTKELKEVNEEKDRLRFY